MPTNSLKATRLTKLTVAPHEKPNQTFNPAAPAIWTLIDVQSFTLPAGSNCAANTTTEFAVPLAGATPGDFYLVEPGATILTGLDEGVAYCLVAGTMRIRFANVTAAIIDAAGTYSFIVFRR